MEIRLQKYLSRAGIASRRKAEELIKIGKITVNNKIVSQMGLKIDDEKDIVKYDGKLVKCEEKRVYIMLNKPEGYITTVNDQFNRPTVIDLLHGVKERIYPVGRLDFDTSGLLMLMNDGELAYTLTHPKHNIDKKYIANLNKIPKEIELDKLRQGVIIDDYKTSPAKVKFLKKNNKTCVVEVIIHEGKNRQVRKMFETIGCKVIKLKRISIGKLKLGDLRQGEYRYLSNKEIQNLKMI